MSVSIFLENKVPIEQYRRDIGEMGKNSLSSEAVAIKVVNYLNEHINALASESPLALTRFFRTVSYKGLTPELKEYIRVGHPHIQESTNCLTLLATRGIEEQWNRRDSSREHQCIPLISSKMVEKAPMIAVLVKELGIDVNQVVEPSPMMFLHPREKHYRSLHIQEAAGNASLPAQSEFIDKYKIRSVVGFGNLLSTGDMFAVIMFFRIFIPAETARAFAELAGSIEGALNDVRTGKTCNILVADVAEGVSRIARVLPKEHNFFSAQTVAEAMNLWTKQNFDLVICGTHFDESRMFDLLKAVKQKPDPSPKPFICFQEQPSDVLNQSDAIMEFTATKLGARCFLNATKMTDTELCSALESYLPANIWENKPD